MKKKIVAFCILFSLCLGMVSVTASAAEQTNTSDNETVTEQGITEETGSDNGTEETLSVEFTNSSITLQNALAQSVAATIAQERTKLPKYTEDELMYLACLIYCESGDQDFEGMVAVGNVVMNRAESEEFDHVNTIKEVIYDCERWGRQFSPVYVKSGGKWTTKGSAYEKALTMYKTGVYPKDWQQPQMERCIVAAKACLEGRVVLKEKYLYFNMGITKTKEKCKKNGSTYQIIGYHIFY